MKKHLLVLSIVYLGSAIAADKAKEQASEIFEGEPMVIDSELWISPKRALTIQSAIDRKDRQSSSVKNGVVL
ncbi:MAG: hypothetical protein IBX56_11900 [Methylomicrobium sp.]|nr:hypothetical protein [Methylomicrobium sp.]